MDPYLRIVKLGFRAFDLNIRGFYRSMEKNVVVYFVMGIILIGLMLCCLGSRYLVMDLVA
jgi:hypothetical protein